MSYMETVVSFVVIWWLVMFLTLPFGNKWDEPDEIQTGLAKGAPTKNTFRTRAIITTAITLVITATINIYLNFSS